MRRGKDQEPVAVQGNFLLVTDNKEGSTPWFNKGLKMALDGYASTSLVDRAELEQKLGNHEEITAVIVDAVNTNGWKEYVHELRGKGLVILVVSESSTWDGYRDARVSGASDYFPKTAIPEVLRGDILGR